MQHRFEALARQAFDDGWGSVEETSAAAAIAPKTEVIFENARSALATNDSPDIYFDRSVNPYRGCEHGCVYCYARPTHSYLNLSPGLDFESKIIAKSNIVSLLKNEISKPSYSASRA